MSELETIEVQSSPPASYGAEPSAVAPPKPSDDTDDDEPSTKKLGLCTILGHSWHWAEVYFLLICLASVALTVLAFIDVPFPSEIVAILSIFTCLIAFMYTWNLCTTRRIAASADTLAGSVKSIQHENTRLIASYDKLTEQNATFGGYINKLEDAKNIVGDAVSDLGAIQAKEQELQAELEKIVERRLAFNKKLNELLDSEAKNAAVQTKLNLREMTLSAVYADKEDESVDVDAYADVAPDAERGTIWTRAHMERLCEQLHAERISWDEDDLRDVLIEDEYVTQFQLYSIMEPLLDAHFARVSEDYQRLKELEAEKKRLEDDVRTEQRNFIKRQAEAQKKKLMMFYRQQDTIADDDVALLLV